MIRPVGQAVKTPPFHGGNSSSILLRVTKIKKQEFVLLLFYFDYPTAGELSKLPGTDKDSITTNIHGACNLIFVQPQFVYFRAAEVLSIICYGSPK